jgi:hypothetical protein
MLDAARVSFTATTAAIRAGLLGGTILQFDETGLRVGKKNWWLWVFHPTAPFSSSVDREARRVRGRFEREIEACVAQ